MQHTIELEMSKDGVWWKCGGRVRRITDRQADRVLEALAELFATYAAKRCSGS